MKDFIGMAKERPLHQDRDSGMEDKNKLFSAMRCKFGGLELGLGT